MSNERTYIEKLTYTLAEKDGVYEETLERDDAIRQFYIDLAIQSARVVYSGLLAQLNPDDPDDIVLIAQLECSFLNPDAPRGN